MGIPRRLTMTATGAAGGAGVATANVTSEPIRGEIVAVYLAYLSSPPAGTTDVTLAGSATPALPVLTITDAATDGWFFPMWQADDAADGSDITNQGRPVIVDGALKLTIAQANNDDGVTATVVYVEMTG